MRVLIGWFMALAMTVALSGCNFLDTPAPENPAARQVMLGAVADLETGNSTDLLARLVPELRPKLANAIASMQAALPSGSPRTESVVFADSRSIQNNGTQFHIDRYTVEVAAGGRYAYVRGEVTSQTGHPALTAIYINAMPMPYREFTGITFSHMTVGKWLILLGAILSPVVTIAAWVVLWRSQAFIRKWPWAIAIAVSIFQITLRWPDGAFNIQPIYFQLLGSGFMKSTYPVDGPWMISVALPVFAIWVIVHDYRARRRAAYGF